ncbi:hypothetical protein HMPREF1624_05235 [Sporothrix schenckii ATCC 58251]|uniref:Trafficking protein particle complex II-specific subunit 65 IgD3 domain-containing protein n=1 Tax=Sporothrix schenckii (strain ATCC 58251 / de Perez 2211183) TaxID=1391915 RepID=U7PU54_SPOS1|nr:hypothetical protein HMPREF1624_05235 [Sporothrix schenckii ATCC 58251]
MAVPSTHEAALADGDGDFVRDSYLAYVVPLATDSRLEQDLELCASKGESLQALIEGIEDRESLFFDETVDVYLILRTPYQSDPHLRNYLERLAIVLEAQILNSHVSGRDATPPVVETIFNGAVENIDEPLAIVSEPGVASGRKTTDAKGGSDEESSESGESGDDDDTQLQKTGETAEDEGVTRQTYCVWKLPVFLARPRARLHGPSVSFSAVASLKPVSAVAAKASAEGNGSLAPYGDANGLLGGLTPSGRMAGYLQSREPSGLNLLESFGGDPALAGAWPRLSAQRVSRVAPAAAAMNPRFHPRPLRGIKSIAFNIFPAVHTRVRFARPNAAPSSPAVVAMLEIDFTPFFDCEAVLSSINISLPSGEITDLNTADGLALPLYCVARDHFTFLYRLAPLEFDISRPPSQHNHQGRLPGAHGGSFSGTGNGFNGNGNGNGNGGASAAARDLDISIEAKVLVKPGVCTPTLKMTWVTSLDFTLPVNPGFGTALMPPPSIQRAHRPSQLSIDGMSSFTAPSVSRPDALPSLEAAATHNTATTIPDFGITMTFTAPSHKVYAGEEFSWTVFVVNRASQMPLTPTLPTSATLGGGVVPPPPPAPRKLALIALPKRRRNDVRVIRPPSTAGGRPHPRVGPNGALDDTGTVVEAVADAVLDENIVHAMQRSSLVDSTDVVCLSSADTRVGPLAPNACYSVDLRFVALRAGAVGIEAIRVVDLGSQEHVDVRELPVMIIAEGKRGDDETN